MTLGRDPLHHRLGGVLILAVFGATAILIEIAPLTGPRGGTPTPDLLFCVATFLAIRRPSGSPAAIILLLGLARDLISGGPVGLGALVLLGGVETLRASAEGLRRRGRLIEFALVVLVACAMGLAQYIVLAITFAAPPPLGALALRATATGLAYLAVFFLFRQILRIRAERPRDMRLSTLAD